MFDFSFDIDQDLQFLAKIYACFLAIFVFFFLALINRCRLIVRIISTFCVAPIFRELVLVFACDDENKLLADKDITCYEDMHRKLAYATLVAAFVYLLLLLPFTAAEGDLEAMPKHVWLRPREWMVRKEDKILGLDQGKLNESVKGNLYNKYLSTLLTPVLLSGIDVFVPLRHKSRVLHGSLALLFSCIPLVANLVWKPMQDPFVNSLILLSHFLCMGAFIAALVALVLDDPTSTLPAQTLYFGWFCIGVGFVIYTFVYFMRKCCGRHQTDFGRQQASVQPRYPVDMTRPLASDTQAAVTLPPAWAVAPHGQQVAVAVAAPAVAVAAPAVAVAAPAVAVAAPAVAVDPTVAVAAPAVVWPAQFGQWQQHGQWQQQQQQWQQHGQWQQQRPQYGQQQWRQQ